MMTSKQHRLLFFSAAWFNWIAGGSLLFFYPQIYRLVGAAHVPTEPMFLHLTCAVVVVFGYGYYLVGKNPTANQSIAILGVLGKLAFAGIVWGHWLLGEAPWQLATLVTVDFVYAVLFGLFLWGQAPGKPPMSARAYDEAV